MSVPAPSTDAVRLSLGRPLKATHRAPPFSLDRSPVRLPSPSGSDEGGESGTNVLSRSTPHAFTTMSRIFCCCYLLCLWWCGCGICPPTNRHGRDTGCPRRRGVGGGGWVDTTEGDRPRPVHRPPLFARPLGQTCGHSNFILQVLAPIYVQACNYA